MRETTADVFNGRSWNSQRKFQIDITLSMLRVHLSDGKFDWIVCEMAMLCFDEVFTVFSIPFQITNSSNVFNNLLHYFFSRSLLTLNSWKRKQTSWWSKTVFSHFDSWKRNHNKYLLKTFVDSEFEIGETIWWIR